MAEAAAAEYPLPVDEQDRLDDPIRIRWAESQASRAKMLHSLGASFEDADAEQPFIGAGKRALTRQKTNVVIATVQEAESILYELDQYLSPHGLDTPRGAGTRPHERVRDGLEIELKRRGYTVDRDGRRPDVSSGGD